jgi:excisionase family DNA binding protein
MKADDSNVPERRINIEQLREHATLTVAQVALLLGVSRHTAYEGVRTGSLPSVKLGRRILIPTAQLLRLLGDATPIGQVVPEDV